VGRDAGAVAVGHVVEEDAEVGFGDADGALHRLRRQADLVALDAATLAQLERCPRLLDRVGVLDGHAGVLERKLATRGARPVGVVEALRGLRELLGREAHDEAFSARTALRSTPTPETSTS